MTIGTTTAIKHRPLRTYRSIIEISRELSEDNLPFLRILELAYRSGARYCLQWNDYNNLEWLAERRLVYANTFPQQPDYVIRLDLFSSNPTPRKGNLYTTKKPRYLGYVSLRPGTKRTVVECCISPPDDTSNHYLLCASSLDTSCPVDNTRQSNFHIDGICPFIQQDEVSGVCAHACLRTVSLVLEKKFPNCSSKTVQDIHERTSNMPLLEGSHIPSTGLTEFEIFSAVEAMGATPILKMFEGDSAQSDDISLEQLIYPYVESGIPVMVGIRTETQAHVVAVVGHVFDKDSWWQRAEGYYYPSMLYPSMKQGETWLPSYLWVPEFIVQDDNFGPYTSVPRTLLRIWAQSVVIPVPSSCGVFLPGHKAESMSASFINSEFREYFLRRTQTSQIWRNIFSSAQEQQRIVLRTLLISKENFIRHVTETKFSQQLLNIYNNQISLPSWIWMVEVSTPELFTRGLKVGEIILNAQFPEQHISHKFEPLLSLRVLDVTVIGTDFFHPNITLDRNPSSVLTRPTFDNH